MSRNETTAFVFSLTLQPNAAFEGGRVFLHGKILRAFFREEEQEYEVGDEKGTWNGYEMKKGTHFSEGEKVRAYGRIRTQPDGKTKVELYWIKAINESEFAFMETQTQNHWEKVKHLFPQKMELPNAKKENNEKESTPKEKNEFVPADQLTIEREYV